MMTSMNANTQEPDSRRSLIRRVSANLDLWLALSFFAAVVLMMEWSA